MTNIERTPQRMILKSGSTTLIFDKEAGKVIRQRKVLLWEREPAESPLSDIAEVKVDAVTDPTSGAEVCNSSCIVWASDSLVCRRCSARMAFAAA